jgi:hypothetical protein
VVLFVVLPLMFRSDCMRHHSSFDVLLCFVVAPIADSSIFVPCIVVGSIIVVLAFFCHVRGSVTGVPAKS